MSALCHERLTWPIDASRGDVAKKRWLAHALRWRVVWLDLGWITHARILLSRLEISVNLLPTRADFVTERDNESFALLFCSEFAR